MELESILLPGIEAKRPIVIAGPCSAETEEQVMETAKQLAAKGQKIYRAGIWKPRTSLTSSPVLVLFPVPAEIPGEAGRPFCGSDHTL